MPKAVTDPTVEAEVLNHYRKDWIDLFRKKTQASALDPYLPSMDSEEMEQCYQYEQEAEKTTSIQHSTNLSFGGLDDVGYFTRDTEFQPAETAQGSETQGEMDLKEAKAYGKRFVNAIAPPHMV